jgi:hypothetical protein
LHQEVQYSLGMFSPVYRYVLQQRPSYPVETEAGIQFKARYSYHNWDSVGFFGIISDYYTPTKEDRIYEQMIQREILHFARSFYTIRI